MISLKLLDVITKSTETCISVVILLITDNQRLI